MEKQQQNGKIPGIKFLTMVMAGMITIPLLACFGKVQQKEEKNKTVSAPVPEAIAAGAPKRIGVIGAGWLGGTVGKLLVRSGHEVMFSSRHPEELKAMAEALGPRASAGTPKEAAAFGDILLFAVPYDAIPQLGTDLKEEIKGKIVLDACNGGSGDLGKEVEANGAGRTSAKYLAETKLVRAFSAQDATQIEASFNRNGKDRLAIPIASDYADALEVAAQLVRDAGCEPVVAGDLSAGVKFQRGTPAFRNHTNASGLRKVLGLPQEKN